MSHLHTIMRPHHFNFDVRFSYISALMSKTIHRSRIQRWVLSLIYAYDQFYNAESGTLAKIGTYPRLFILLLIPGTLLYFPNFLLEHSNFFDRTFVAFLFQVTILEIPHIMTTLSKYTSRVLLISLIEVHQTFPGCLKLPIQPQIKTASEHFDVQYNFS